MELIYESYYMLCKSNEKETIYSWVHRIRIVLHGTTVSLVGVWFVLILDF